MRDSFDNDDWPTPEQRHNSEAASLELNPETEEPSRLRDAVYTALVKLPPKQRDLTCRRLLGELQRAGVNVASRLFVLGIPARSPEELTPNDMGKLLSSVRAITPSAMSAVSGTLSGLLSGT